MLVSLFGARMADFGVFVAMRAVRALLIWKWRSDLRASGGACDSEMGVFFKKTNK